MIARLLSRFLEKPPALVVARELGKKLGASPTPQGSAYRVAGTWNGMRCQVVLDGVLTFVSDDPDTPLAHLTVRATSSENQPPVAAARVLSPAPTVDAIVGEPVAVDGADSADPEGDPLVYGWTLVSPATSQAVLEDPSAARVLFTPDRAGSYRVDLVVTDTLGQLSAAPAAVSVRARPRYIHTARRA